MILSELRQRDALLSRHQRNPQGYGKEQLSRASAMIRAGTSYECCGRQGRVPLRKSAEGVSPSTLYVLSDLPIKIAGGFHVTIATLASHRYAADHHRARITLPTAPVLLCLALLYFKSGRVLHESPYEHARPSHLKPFEF